MIALKIETQIVFMADDWYEVSDKIYEKQKEGFMVGDLDFGVGKYIAVLNKGCGWSDQERIIDSKFKELPIKEIWDKGLYISGVIHDNLLWIMYFADGTGINGQSWRLRTNFNEIQEEVEKLWKEDKTVTRLGHYEDQYVLIMSGGLNWDQTCFKYTKFPADKIKKVKTEDNKLVTEITDVAGQYFVVASSGTGYSEQEIVRTTDFASLPGKIENLWAEGYNITTATFVKEELVLIFSK